MEKLSPQSSSLSPSCPDPKCCYTRILMLAAIESFGEMLRVERNASPHTARNYTSDLRQLRQFLLGKGICIGDTGDEIDLSRVDTTAVRSYVAWLLEGHRKSSVGR